MGRKNKILMDIFQSLAQSLGRQHWWPAETAFEVAVGAILTQNTSWNNTVLAINNLKSGGLLSLEALAQVDQSILAEKIRQAGYYNLKAGRLKNFLGFIMNELGGRFDALFQGPLAGLRENLLRVKGIGPETADSILLYAGGLPTFVVDAYTRRVLVRHALVSEDDGYDEIRDMFMDHLPADVELFNEFHALFVKTGHLYCRPKPRCQGCPLEHMANPYSGEY
ncbi:MAG: endonuclease III domain-containing protein [Deltaproteobacteria bacterium]|nr:endonuclease III domain-containing protein [Deltaproteobacteria bacterium]